MHRVREFSHLRTEFMELNGESLSTQFLGNDNVKELRICKL